MLLLPFFILIFISSVVFPQYAIIIIYINLAIALGLSALQVGSLAFPKFRPIRSRLKSQPFVSILVPSYNEPPAILMNTLDSLANLDYKNFEVLVIDNNTRDESIWKPVEKFVKTVGKNFRFFHVDNLDGFKAGALNYLLKYVDKKTEYAAVIDADYVVNRNFLKVALPYFANDKIALVQFPQRYRNSIKKNKPIIDEYGHFFGVYMNMANHLNCVLSTGTVSIYKLDVLSRIGGFCGKSLTEDADIGLRIYGSGYNGVYVDYPVGYGLIPYDLEAYRKQKWRWAFGNTQSLKILALLFGKIPFKSWIGFLSHLTAWDHFHFIPFAVLASFTVMFIPGLHITGLHRHLLDAAVFTILITIISKLLLFIVDFKYQGKGTLGALHAFIIHMGMTVIYSEAWLVFLLRGKLSFERTNKFILNKMPSLLKNSYKELILGLWFVVGAIEALLSGRPDAAMAFIMAATILLSIYYVHWAIIPTKKYSRKMISLLDKRYRKYIIGRAKKVKNTQNNKVYLYENSFTGSALEEDSAGQIWRSGIGSGQSGKRIFRFGP